MLLIMVSVMVGCQDGHDHEGEHELAGGEATTDNGLYLMHLEPSPDIFVAGEEVSLGMHMHDAADDSVVISGATVAVEPWMPEHGHGVDTSPAVEEVAEAYYEASWVFSMGGYWELTVTVDGSLGSDTVVLGYEVE